MTIRPEELEPYRMPPGAEAEEMPDYDLGLGWVINVVQWRYRGALVGYALNHYAEDESEETKDVARIDCCHAHIHEHQKFRNGNPERYVDIVPLERGAAWGVIQQEYPNSYIHMVDNWEWHEERWERGY